MLPTASMSHAASMSHGTACGKLHAWHGRENPCRCMHFCRDCSAIVRYSCGSLVLLQMALVMRHMRAGACVRAHPCSTDLRCVGLQPPSSVCAGYRRLQSQLHCVPYPISFTCAACAPSCAPSLESPCLERAVFGGVFRFLIVACSLHNQLGLMPSEFPFGFIPLTIAL